MCNNDSKRKSVTGGPNQLLEIEHAGASSDFQDTGNQMNVLREIRVKNTKRIIIGHLDIKSLRNKFEMLEEIIKDKIDIFLIFETKHGSSFLAGQFMIKGYSTPFRLDTNQNGRGLLLSVLEGIPCKILYEYTSEKPIENIFIEINLRSRKCFLSCREIYFCSSKYDNVIVLGDLNIEISNTFLEQFCASYNFKALKNLHASNMLIIHLP